MGSTECAFLYGHLSHKHNMEKWRVNNCSWYKQASSQTLPGALATGLEKEGELATMSLEFEFHLQSQPGLDPHCQISTNQRDAETSKNVNENWKTCAKSNDAITNVISVNQHNFFTLTFSMQIFKFQTRSCKLSFLFPPQSAPESLLAG